MNETMQCCENIRYYRYSPVVNTSSTNTEMWACDILRTQGLPQVLPIPFEWLIGYFPIEKGYLV